MNATIKDFVEEEEVSTPMSNHEYDSFLERMGKKKYINDALIKEDGTLINANDQILEGARILEENKVGM
jgi:hypothetical protein